METTIDSILRTRVQALLTKHDLTATGAAKAMGRSHTWLLRKLDPAREDSRPLMVADLTEVLDHLGEPPAALLAPVLLPGDLQLMQFVADAQLGLTAAELSIVFVDSARASARLIGQGLIHWAKPDPDEGPTLNITPAGTALLTN